MMRVGPMLALAIVGAQVLVAAPAIANDPELITARRAGPMKLSTSTFDDAKGFFGDPTSTSTKMVGCSKVTDARWRGRLKMYFYQDDRESVADIRVRDRTIRSGEMRLTIHTRRGLKVDDSEARLQELYPHKKGITHHGHTHYILRDRESKLLAKVVDGVVVELEVAPYEFC
jgi:hypothetical protein